MVWFKEIHRTLILALCLLSLQGCGFHLKQGATISSNVSPLSIEGLDRHSDLRIALTQLLVASDITVVEQGVSASTYLRINNQQSTRRVISVDGNGKVAEYELYESARFQLVSSNGEQLVKGQNVDTISTYLNPETEVLGKQQEESILRQDMRRTLADRIIRRLDSQL